MTDEINGNLIVKKVSDLPSRINLSQPVLKSSIKIAKSKSKDLNGKIKIANEYLKPKKPGKIVSNILIIFLRAVFDENFKKGHWHMDPKDEMYIRNHYPEDPNDSGIKPGIVEGQTGGVMRGIRYLGEVNFLPMQTRNLSTMGANDEIFSGEVTLKAISTVKEEAEEIAYLCNLSINMFVAELIGAKGIAHIDSRGYQKARPSDISTEVKLWESIVPVEYVIRIPYSSTRLDGDRLEDVESELELKLKLKEE